MFKAFEHQTKTQLTQNYIIYSLCIYIYIIYTIYIYLIICLLIFYFFEKSSQKHVLYYDYRMRYKTLDIKTLL